MREDLFRFLESLEVYPTDDEWIVDLALSFASDKIMNFCNVTIIPDELTKVCVQMAAGEFLRLKKASGAVPNVNLEGVIEQIKEGDTTVVFSGQTSPEQRYDTIVKHLIDGNKQQLIAFRRMRW